MHLYSCEGSSGLRCTWTLAEAGVDPPFTFGRDRRDVAAPLHVIANEVGIIALAVGDIAAGQRERYRQALSIDAEMDFSRKATFDDHDFVGSRRAHSSSFIKPRITTAYPEATVNQKSRCVRIPLSTA